MNRITQLGIILYMTGLLFFAIAAMNELRAIKIAVTEIRATTTINNTFDVTAKKGSTVNLPGEIAE